MTVSNTANSMHYAGNGTTKAFAFPYIFFAPTDLIVTLVNTATNTVVTPPPVLNGLATYDYTVTGVVTHGTVTFVTAPPGGYTVSLVRAVPAIQTVTLIDNTKFPADTINTEFDYLTVLAQQVSSIAGSALHIPENEVGLVVEAAVAANRAGKVLAWDDFGNLIHSTAFLIDMEGLGGGASIYVGPSPPNPSADGQLWFKSDAVLGGGQLYVRYRDVDSIQWVPASPAAGGAASTPTGAILDFAGATPPVGWLLCDGATYNTADFADLFQVIQYTYGGSGGTFRVPDLGGRVTAGKEASPTRLTVGGSGINGSILGASGGVQTYALTSAHLASHFYDLTDHVHNGPGGVAYLFANAGTAFGYTQPSAATYVGYSSTTGGLASTIATGSTGSSTAHQNTQPTLIMNKIIKV